jgi:hypothetical protein
MRAGSGETAMLRPPGLQWHQHPHAHLRREHIEHHADRHEHGPPYEHTTDRCGGTRASIADVRAVELPLRDRRVGALTPVQAFRAGFALLVPDTRIQEL